MKNLSILLTLFIFASFNEALCDPVKSMEGAAVQVTERKIDKNKDVVQKNAAPAKKPAGWIKKNQTPRGDISFLRAREEMTRSLWVESPDKVISSREFLENVWKNHFFSPSHVREVKSSPPDSGRSASMSSRDGIGLSEGGNFLTTLRHLHSKEQTFKEIFMGFRFSFDLTSRRVFLHMDVAPSTETPSGFMIRF